MRSKIDVWPPLSDPKRTRKSLRECLANDAATGAYEKRVSGEVGDAFGSLWPIPGACRGSPRASWELSERMPERPGSASEGSRIVSERPEALRNDFETMFDRFWFDFDSIWSDPGSIFDHFSGVWAVEWPS